jgi:hypothetical protein
MPAGTDVPERKEFSPSMRVDLMVSDWRAALPPESSVEEKERDLYGAVWEAYQEGDFGFGLWCWHECDRLSNNLNGNIREVTRILGPGRYFGFSHRKALASAVPIEKIYRPRKGDMSTPRPDAYVLPHYQVLCVYFAKAETGDPKARALLEISLGELEDLRRNDAFLKHFEMFRDLWNRTKNPPPAAPTAPVSAPADPEARAPAKRPRKSTSKKSP